jgi:DNA-binding ferritin-like protein
MTLRSTDYALLSQDSYQDPVLNKKIELDGIAYRAIDTMDNPRTGFQATAYQREDTHEVVIAYRGTEFDREPVHDGGVDAGMVLAGVNAQQSDSSEFTQRVLDRVHKESERAGHPIDVTVTGHSLGGTLAELNAAKFGLKGETFNAYGAASLRGGPPEGGTQVIDHVRAGDLVSAASPHFGEVRVYAAQKDIDTLSHAGYRDDSGILSPRNPIKAIDFDAHAIDNFVPNSKLLGQSIIDPENQARYRAHEGMIDRYRNDVGDIRLGLSATWEIPKAIGELKDAVEHKVAEVVEDGAYAIERGVEHIAHEAKEGFDHLKEGVKHVRDEIAEGAHAIGEKASGAWNTLTHPGSWFEHDKPTTAKLNEAAHPDHQLFKQARDAVHRLDADHQRTPDQRSENIAASLTVAAREKGLERVDHAALNGDASRIYAVQGEPNSPFKKTAEVATPQAATTSVEQSSQAWNDLAARRQQEQLAQSATQQNQRQNTQGNSLPGM